jgi:uncharacterized integral membrane protein
MGSLWLKIKIWTKVSAAALISIYLLIFFFQNGHQKATFWYWFNRNYEGSLLLLVLFSFLIGGLVALLATTTFRTIRQIRELRNRNRAAKLQAEVNDMKAKAAMLQTRPQPAASAGGVGEKPGPRVDEPMPTEESSDANP